VTSVGLDRFKVPFAVNGLGVFQRANDETEDGRKILETEFQSHLNSSNRTKWNRGLQHFENASFLLGNHITRYYFAGASGLGMHTFGVNDTNRADPIVAKVADNQLIRPVETVVGLMTESLPMPRVEPNSDSVEDEDAASLGEMLIKVTFEKPLNMPQKLQEAALTAIICGHAIAEVEYTATGLPVEVPALREGKRRNPLFDPKNDPADEEFITVPEYVPGRYSVDIKRDIVCRIWTPFHIDVDPAATRPEDLTWIIRSSYEDIDYIKEEFNKKETGYYPENLEHLSQQNSEHHILYWWSRFQDILETPQTVGSGFTDSGSRYLPQGQSPNQTLFSIMDVKPSRQYPRGRTMIFAGGKLIYAGDARAWSEQYKWRWHPYSFLPWFKLPGKFWGSPLLTFTVPLQKKINAIDAQVHANRQYLSIGQWLIPKSCQIAEGKFSAIPGEQFTYIDSPGGNKPEKIGNVPLSPELIGERNQLVRSIEMISASGVMDTSDISPSAARAAEMLDFTRREKLRSKAPLFQNLNAFLEGIAQNVLIEFQLNLLDEDPALTARMRQVAREHDTVSVDNFTGASLRDHHAVVIDIASELMHSPEAKEARAVQFLQFAAGLQFLQPDERAAIRKIVRVDEFMRNTENAAVKRARRMVSRIIAGDLEAFKPIESADVPAAMEPVFRKAVLSPKMEEYDADVSMLLLAAFDYYAQLVAKEQQAMLEMQIKLQGAMKGGQ